LGDYNRLDAWPTAGAVANKNRSVSKLFGAALIEFRPGKPPQFFLDRASERWVFFAVDQALPETWSYCPRIIADDYGPCSRVGPDIQDADKVFHQVPGFEVPGEKQPWELHFQPDAPRNVVGDCRLTGKLNQPVSPTCRS